jgi:hypothetical protein
MARGPEKRRVVSVIKAEELVELANRRERAAQRTRDQNARMHAHDKFPAQVDVWVYNLATHLSDTSCQLCTSTLASRIQVAWEDWESQRGESEPTP